MDSTSQNMYWGGTWTRVLHNPGGTQQRVLHRDIKSSNILLDENWNAKILDLGLSKFGPANQAYTFLVSHAVGTFGYCDLVYVETGLLTKESDVYSFGIVLFEILCGRLSICYNNDRRPPLTVLVREYYEDKRINEIIYSNIKNEINNKSLEVFTTMAYQCLNTSYKKRPLMTQVVSRLELAFEYQAKVESKKVMDIIPRFAEGSYKTEIVDFSHLRALRLPDQVAASKILYTDSGKGLLVLASSGIHKLWKWQQKSTASVVPLLWQPKNGSIMLNDGSVMLNDIYFNRPAEESVACIALSKNQFYVVSASGGKVTVYNLPTFKVMTTFMPPPPAATYLSFHPQNNNIIAVGKDDSTIEIYNAQTETRLRILKGHRKQITGLAFSQALKSLVSSGADAQLCVWNASNWEKEGSISLQSPPGYQSSLDGDTKIQYHIDQQHLLVIHESQISVYGPQLECMKSWYPRDSLSAPISTATFSCDSLLIFTGFSDGVVGVFDTESLTLHCRIPPSAYISSSISSRKRTPYPIVVAAHPSDPTQFALGMNGGSVYVIEPEDADQKLGISAPQEIGTIALFSPSYLLNIPPSEATEIEDESLLF